MALTKHKLKKQMMEKTMKNAERGGGKREDNPKILPYYKLETGEKLEIMFQPYEDGDLFKHFKKHGANMQIPSIGNVECIYHSRGESCPACAKGFSYVEDGKGTPMSKKWMAKDYYVAQVVVIDSPFDIPELEDGNQMRIFYMPFAVMEKIKESYAEGIVEDPTDHVFVIKKTENQGGNASYANSFFRPKPAGDEIYEAFEDATIELHDLVKENIEPEEASVEEVEEWVEKADKALREGDGGSRRSSSNSDDDDKKDDDTPRTSGGGLKNRMKKKQEESDPEPDEDNDDDDRPEEKEEKPSSTGSSLRDRLRRSRGA